MFITFEGIEGSSKTTQAALLSQWLDELEIDHVLTKEPGTAISKECKQIRKILLDPESDIVSKAEFFLYLADRAQHVEKIIRPALDDYKWVISDRYSDSTYVYQGVGRGLAEHSIMVKEKMESMIDFAASYLVPDMTFIMDLPVEIGLKRARESNIEFEGGDRFEREELQFHERLRSGFLQIYDDNKYGRCRLLDATKTIEELHEEVKCILSPCLLTKEELGG